MPLIKIEHLDKGTVWGIWRATESPDYFLSRLHNGYLTGFDAQRFSEIRKKEFLASRFLLKRLLNDENVTLGTMENGSVFVKDTAYHISLSHSKEMVVAIVSEKALVGIDVEEISERVKKVMFKFLNDDELKLLGSEPELWKIVLCWSAKESIYKMVGTPGLSFKNELMLNIPADKNRGQFKTSIRKGGGVEEIEVHYGQIDEFIFTYCIKEQNIEL